MKTMRKQIRRLRSRFGLEPRRTDLEPEFLELYERCRPYTMTSVERMYGLYQAVRYVVMRGVPGDIVECGVWRGGSAMLCALSLQRMSAFGRSLYLYDTFAGMTEPTDTDGAIAQEK